MGRTSFVTRWRLLSWSVLSILATAAGGLATVVQAEPAQIFIIRHGEKPKSGPDLNKRGEKRAEALVSLFATDTALLARGTPTFIFAAAPSHKDSSQREIETATPLAQSLGLTVITDYTKEQYEAIADELRTNSVYDGATVLIVWEHTLIPDLAKALGAKDAPKSWGGSVFDRIWVLDYSGDNVTSFEDLPQHVLKGDSAT